MTDQCGKIPRHVSAEGPPALIRKLHCWNHVTYSSQLMSQRSWFFVRVPGFGFPDDVVIEKKNKGDSFIESTGVDVRLLNVKFIQHDAIEGILCEY